MFRHLLIISFIGESRYSPYFFFSSPLSTFLKNNDEFCSVIIVQKYNLYILLYILRTFHIYFIICKLNKVSGIDILILLISIAPKFIGYVQIKYHISFTFLIYFYILFK